MPGQKRQRRPEPTSYPSSQKEDALKSNSQGSKAKTVKRQKKSTANQTKSSNSVATTTGTPRHEKSTVSNHTTTTTSTPTSGSTKSKSATSSKNTKNKNASMEDWITSLAKESVQVQSSTSGGAASASGGLSKAVQAIPLPSTKEERMERRAAKKARRLAKHTPSPTTTNHHPNEPGHHGGQMMGQRTNENNDNKSSSVHHRQHHNQALSKQRLQALAVVLRSIDRAKSSIKESSSNKFKKVSQQQQQQKQQPFRGGAKAGTRECKKMKRPWDETTIQPRNSDYSGIGLARTSLYIRFDDLSFFPKLKQEFAEHIPGFFGKQRSKAMKRQLDGNMLWRQLLANRSSGSTSTSSSIKTNATTTTKGAATTKGTTDHGHNTNKNLNIAIHGKKLSKMTPDERVEAMIQAGMI